MYVVSPHLVDYEVGRSFRELREPRGQGMFRDHALFRRRLFGRLLALRAPDERERFRCKAVTALLSQLISSII